MAKIGEQQFFAIQRLKDQLQAAEKKRIRVEDLCLLDMARSSIQAALGETDADVWASHVHACARRLKLEKG